MQHNPSGLLVIAIAGYFRVRSIKKSDSQNHLITRSLAHLITNSPDHQLVRKHYLLRCQQRQIMHPQIHLRYREHIFLAIGLDLVQSFFFPIIFTHH